MAIATTQDLVKFLRISILDDSGGQGVDWTTIDEGEVEESLLRWSNEALVDYINEAIRQVYRRILPVQEHNATLDIAVTATTPDYSLDDRIIRVIGVRLNSTGKQLEPLDLQDVWKTSTNWDTLTGEVTKYILDYDTGKIKLVRIPIVDDTLELLVNRFPMTELAWASPSGTPELRLEYRIPMLHYAAFLAYMKDEPNTFDPDKAQIHLELFNKEFPETSAYSDTRKRRTNNRTVKYGGIPL